MLKSILTPNHVIDQTVAKTLIAGWLAVSVLFWVLVKPTIFPNPFEVLEAFPVLFSQFDLTGAILSSLTVSVESLLLSIVISLPLAYLSRTPIVRPVAVGLSKLRFLSPAVFFVILVFLLNGGHALKVWMLALGESFFLVTTMVTVVTNIPQFKFDDARTLRMSEWMSVWYVVIRGTLPDTLDAIRDNAAMGWSMLMMVEGFVRAEGGVGVLLLNHEKYQNFAEIYAIATAIVVVGVFQDYVIGVVKAATCPYAVTNV